MQEQEFTGEQFSQLVGGGECFIHVHPKEPVDFSDVIELQAAEPITVVTGDYTPTKVEGMLLVDTSAGNVTITLPTAFNGREWYVIKMVPQNILFVVPTPPDTILGSTDGVAIYGQFTALHFKAITGGFICK